MDSGERGMNPVVMTIINPRKEYWLSQGSNLQLPVLESCALLTELWGSAACVGPGSTLFEDTSELLFTEYGSYIIFNPVPHMQILGSSNSAEKKKM